MPRIPGPADVGSRRAARPQNVRNIGAEQQAQAEVGETIANVANQLRQRRQEAENAGFTAEYSAAYRMEAQQLQNELKSTALQGQESYHEVLDKRLQERENDLIGELQRGGARPSQSAINRAHTIAARVRGNAGIQAVTFENNVRVSRAVGKAKGSLRAFELDAFNNPDEAGEARQRGLEAIAGIDTVDPVQASKLRQNFKTDLTDARINGLITQDPGRALRNLMDGEFDENITADQKLTLINRAVEETEDRERLIDKQLDELRDQTERDYLVRMFDPDQPNPTEAELVSDLDRGRLDRQSFLRLRNLRRAGAEEDDARVRLGLLRQAQQGVPGTPNQIMAAVERNEITQNTAASLLNKHATAARRGGPLANELVERQRHRIDQVIGGVRGPLAVLDSARSARVANALQDYDRRILEGEDEKQAADEVIERFRLAPPSPTEFAEPMFLVGPRQSPDINATRRAILQAFQNGEINKSTARSELENLNRIEQAVEEQEQMRRGNALN